MQSVPFQRHVSGRKPGFVAGDSLEPEPWRGVGWERGRPAVLLGPSHICLHERDECRGLEPLDVEGRERVMILVRVVPFGDSDGDEP